uniref:MOR2-PAG1_N domain-containing protein n=1 Tax=Macrostomum lignano TaxID=282301 RepID=A0A1I8FF43_9PLAT
MHLYEEDAKRVDEAELACYPLLGPQPARVRITNVLLVLCLNVDTDPPDVQKPVPSAVQHCWYDPSGKNPNKARFLAWLAFRLRYRLSQCRAGIEILRSVLRATPPRLGTILNNISSRNPAAAVFRAPIQCSEVTMENSILLCSCGVDEFLPMNPDLPADLFTACLTTPIKAALHWYWIRYKTCSTAVPLRHPIGVIVSNFLLAERSSRQLTAAPSDSSAAAAMHKHPLWCCLSQYYRPKALKLLCSSYLDLGPDAVYQNPIIKEDNIRYFINVLQDPAPLTTPKSLSIRGMAAFVLARLMNRSVEAKEICIRSNLICTILEHLDDPAVRLDQALPAVTYRLFLVFCLAKIWANHEPGRSHGARSSAYEALYSSSAAYGYEPLLDDRQPKVRAACVHALAAYMDNVNNSANASAQHNSLLLLVAAIAPNSKSARFGSKRLKRPTTAQPFAGLLKSGNVYQQVWRSLCFLHRDPARRRVSILVYLKNCAKINAFWSNTPSLDSSSRARQQRSKQQQTHAKLSNNGTFPRVSSAASIEFESASRGFHLWQRATGGNRRSGLVGLVRRQSDSAGPLTRRRQVIQLPTGVQEAPRLPGLLLHSLHRLAAQDAVALATAGSGGRSVQFALRSTRTVQSPAVSLHFHPLLAQLLLCDDSSVQVLDPDLCRLASFNAESGVNLLAFGGGSAGGSRRSSGGLTAGTTQFGGPHQEPTGPLAASASFAQTSLPGASFALVRRPRRRWSAAQRGNFQIDIQLVKLAYVRSLLACAWSDGCVRSWRNYAWPTISSALISPSFVGLARIALRAMAWNQQSRPAGDRGESRPDFCDLIDAHADVVSFWLIRTVDSGRGRLIAVRRWNCEMLRSVLARLISCALQRVQADAVPVGGAANLQQLGGLLFDFWDLRAELVSNSRSTSRLSSSNRRSRSRASLIRACPVYAVVATADCTYRSDFVYRGFQLAAVRS